MPLAAPLTLLWLFTQQAPRPPTQGALERALERVRPALVQVQGPHHRGLGIVVGADGQVLTCTELVGLEHARVRLEAETWDADVVFADARLKAAMVSVHAKRPLSPMPVQLTPSQVGDYVIGIFRSPKGALRPVVGRIAGVGTEADPFLRTTTPLPPGSPLLDAHGALLGVVVARGRSGARALPLTRLKTVLARGEPPP